MRKSFTLLRRSVILVRDTVNRPGSEFKKTPNNETHGKKNNINKGDKFSLLALG